MAEKWRDVEGKKQGSHETPGPSFGRSPAENRACGIHLRAATFLLSTPQHDRLHSSLTCIQVTLPAAAAGESERNKDAYEIRCLLKVVGDDLATAPQVEFSLLFIFIHHVFLCYGAAIGAAVRLQIQAEIDGFDHC